MPEDFFSAYLSSASTDSGSAPPPSGSPRTDAPSPPSGGPVDFFSTYIQTAEGELEAARRKKLEELQAARIGGNQQAQELGLDQPPPGALGVLGQALGDTGEQLAAVGMSPMAGAVNMAGGLGRTLQELALAGQQPGVPPLGQMAAPVLDFAGDALAAVPPMYQEYAGPAEARRQEIKQEAPVAGFVADVAEQVPQILASTAVGGGAPALALLGASAAGQGIQQAEAEGATPGEAVAYGATSGLIEAGTERIGTIPLVDKILKRAIVGPVVKPGAIKRVLKDIAANFGEEAAATVGNELAALATYQQEVSPDLLQKTVYSGLVGAGLGGLVSGGTEVANRIGTPAPQQAPPPQMPPPVVEAPPVQEAAPVLAEPVPVPIVEPLPPQPEVVPQAPPVAPVQPEPVPVVQTVTEAPPPPQKPTRKRKAGPSHAELDQLQAEAAPVEQAPAQPTAPTAAPPVQTVVPQEAQNAQDAEDRAAQRTQDGTQEAPAQAEAGRPAPAAVLEETPDALRRQEGNQEGRQEVAPTPPVPATVPEAVAPAEKQPWQMTREKFDAKNPHGILPGSTPYTRAESVDKLPDDADVWVYHATDDATADALLASGVVRSKKPRTLARENYEAGKETRFQPGAGLSPFIYVGSEPLSVDGYGRRILALKVKKGSLGIPPEGVSLGKKSVGMALADSDAVVTADVSPENIVDVTEKGRSGRRGHEAFVRAAVRDGKPVPAEVLAEYPDLKPTTAAPQGSGIVAGAAAAKPIGPPLERPALTEATPEDAARLVEAAQPIPGPIGEKVQELGTPSAAKSFVQRWFTSRRGLPETARKAMEAREGDIASTRAVAKDLGQSLDRAIYTHVKDLADQAQKATGVEPGLTTIQDGVWEKANAVLDGAVAPKDSGLPQPILDRLRIFREAIDKGSAEIAAEEGMISDEMKEVFGENAGKYVTRTYLVHQIGGERRIRQLRRGGQAEWNAIRDEISAMPEFDGWTTEQIDGWMENELARFEPGRPTQESEGKPPGTQNLSIYKRRKDIPDPIRRLYGEIKNPAVRAFVTITNIRRNLDTFRMYKALREAGLREGWLSEVEKPGFRAVEGSKATAPLQSRRSKKKGTEEEPGGPPRDSLFGKKEILDALRMADDPQRIFIASWLTGAIKSAKTVYSVQAQVRNIMANPLLLLGGGNLGWAPWKRASLRGSLVEASREFKRGSRADAFADLSNVDMKDLAGAWGRAGKLGVTNTNPDLADIRAMMGAQIDADLPPGHRPLSAKELLSSDPGQMLGVRRGLKFVSEKMQTAYRLGDEFFKFVAWQNETAKIRYYRPELTQDQAEVLAADTVRDILPTDQRSIQFLRMLRQFPALGTFISFVSEIPRNAKNVVKLGVKEVTEGKKAGNKRQMEVGIHRLASFVLAASAVPSIGVALAAAIKQATGLKDEEQEKLEAAARVYLPFYAKNQTLAVMKTGKGKAVAFDLSFMDPWAVLKDPILTFFRTGILDEKDLDTRLAAAARETLDPYISEGLGLGLMFDLLRGRNARGIELWDPALPPDEKRRAMANYALRGVEPGVMTTARRVGYGIASEIDKARGGEGVKDPVNRREYDPVTELFAIAGMRPLPIDATTQLGFTARAYSDLTQRAGSQFRKEARASADPEDKPRAEENYRYIYDQGMKELASGVAAARAFGLTDKEIDAILKESRISAEVRKKAMSPENAVLETMETLREKRLKEIEEEVDKERAARRAAAGK